MRFLIAFLTAILTGIIAFLGIITVGSMYIDYVIKPQTGGGLEGLSLMLSLIIIMPILTIFLIFIYYAKFGNWNVIGLFFGAVTGLWFLNIAKVLLWIVPGFMNLVPIFTMIMGYIFVKKDNRWLYINGFTSGTIIGFVVSYSIVIVLRWTNNSLTSYFNFNSDEQLLLLIIFFITAIIGNLIEKKLQRNKIHDL